MMDQEADGRASPTDAGRLGGRSGIHMYFSPYESPYQAFINLMNCMVDLKGKVFRALRR